MNGRFRAALAGEATATPPIWFMRQAGRYHAHYQRLRQRHGFMQLCKDPQLAAEVARGPVEDFGFDVAILFSDLLFPLEALGMPLDYDEGPPRLGWRLDEHSVAALRPWEEALPALEFQREALRLTRAGLPASTSLVGFVGGPWTLMGYAVEGSHRGGLPATQALAPRIGARVLDTLLPLLEANIRLQLEGGAEVVLVLDTAAGVLDAAGQARWVLPALARLAAAFPGRLGYYARDASEAWWDALREARLPLAGIGFDAGVSLERALERREAGFVQGNFDQQHLALPEHEFRAHLDTFVGRMAARGVQGRRGWVCGLGHGCVPQVREAHVRTFVSTVREVLR
ncbi:MAG: uroporphyrinogen decarboxylase family protein [Planctomycetia bacterium]